MPKYFDNITETNTLNQITGEFIVVSDEFKILCASIISKFTFAQNLLQKIIYTTHREKFNNVRTTLRNFPNPRSRMDFLCSYPYGEKDEIIEIVFDFARSIFKEIYEVRNVLTHEIWASATDYPDSILFSNLDENSRLMMASSRVWHDECATPHDVFNATIRYIRNVKIINSNHLRLAIGDIDLCNWCLLNIDNMLNEEDTGRRNELRQSFHIFGGTSHLFKKPPISTDVVEYSSSKKKEITHKN
ncbi:MAG: hypothetical protein KF904_04080 [Rhodoblastus sp.]|nr:hypothetical protein [Rhodoblastus sp.]